MSEISDVHESEAQASSSYNVIAGDVHILALVLDPLISTDRYSEIARLLDGRPVISVAQAALEKDLNYMNASESEKREIVRHLATWVSQTRSEARDFSAAYHPFIWWSTIGVEREPKLAATAMRVFSLSTGSAGAERSFKSRSRIHTKERNRLLDKRADQQTSIIFNSDELERFDSGVLASKRDTPVERLLLLGLKRYCDISGGNLAELLSSTTHQASSNEEDTIDIDLDNDPVFDADIADCDVDALFTLE